MKQLRPPARSTGMGANLVEWTVRMTMLVLAGLVTLSILGSIAAMSNDAAAPPPSAPAGVPVAGPVPDPVPAPEPAPVPAEAAPPAAAADEAPVPAAAGMAEAAPGVLPDRDRHRWLEAIAYGLLALAGLAAIGLVLLWRATRQLARIADAVEARPRVGRDRDLPLPRIGDTI